MVRTSMVSSAYVVLLSVLVKWCAASFDSFSIISNSREDEVPVAVSRLRQLQESSSTIHVSSSGTSSSFISSSNKGIPFDPNLVNKCLGGFAGLGFTLFDLERYNDFFRDDSILTLAQAGSYKGSSSIEEYVRFSTAFSPYVAAADPSEIRISPQLRSIDDVEGTCEFTVVVKREMEMDGRTTAYASRFSFAEMTRFTYDYRNNYIKRMNIYLNDGFFQFYMGTMLDSNKTRNFICNQVMNGVCNFDIQKCQQQLRKLDVFNGGTSTYFDGNSQSCRALHAAFALTNPTQHCPHVSLKPMEDSNGQIKCQASQFVQIEDLFAENDLMLYEEFEIFHAIDPDVGIIETCNKACATRAGKGKEEKEKGKTTGRALL